MKSILIDRVIPYGEMKSVVKEREQHLVGYVAKYGDIVVSQGVTLEQL